MDPTVPAAPARIHPDPGAATPAHFAPHTLPPATLDREIRPARLNERRAARLLLGGALDASVRPLLLVSTCRHLPGVVGAAVLVSGMLQPVPGMRIALRVARPFRRAGMGSGLVASALASAASRGARALYAWRPVEPAGDDAAAWRAMGFRERVTVRHFECDPRRLAAQLEPLCARMARHGWIPPEATVVPLARAPKEPVADLCTRNLGGSRRALRALLANPQPHRLSLDHSWVLMLGPKVGGFLLVKLRDPEVPEVDALAVSPELRLGWANALLKLHSAREAIQNGRRALRFVAHDGHRDTRRMAELIGAQKVLERVIPYRPIVDPQSR